MPVSAGRHVFAAKTVSTEVGAGWFVDTDEDAEDAVQQSLLFAYRGLPRFREESRLTTWLFRIVKNAALNLQERQARRRETSFESLARPPAGDLRDTDDRILQGQLAARLAGALASLSPGHRRVIELDLAGLDNQEAAAVLGITLSVLKLRRFRARRALRDVLQLDGRRSSSQPALDRSRANGGAVAPVLWRPGANPRHHVRSRQWRHRRSHRPV